MPTDGVNKQEKFSYAFISYEQVEGKLRDLEEEIGVTIYQIGRAHV